MAPEPGPTTRSAWLRNVVLFATLAAVGIGSGVLWRTAERTPVEVLPAREGVDERPHIDCTTPAHARWCSPRYSATIERGRLVGAISAVSAHPSGAWAHVDLRVVPTGVDDAPVAPAEPDVRTLRATMSIKNTTSTPYALPDGELLLYVTDGTQLVMRASAGVRTIEPGATVQTTFNVPVTHDDTLTLQGEAWLLPAD